MEREDMLPTRFWADMTWRDFQRVDVSQVSAVLPVAAIEQHGPHLPVGVDAVINDGYVKLAAEKSPDDLPALFLPLQAAGASGEPSEYPGTLSLSVESAIRAWTEIGDSVARAGCRKPRRHQFARRQCRGD
jgi:creatinine amidohydrolase